MTDAALHTDPAAFTDGAPGAAGLIQFGDPAGPAPLDRPTAFGVLAREGRIAVVQIVRADGAYVDLPGGALEAGEDEAAALVREFGEETGLRVAPARLLGRGSQHMAKTDGQPVNNRAALFEARWLADDPALKIEHDHQLRWVEPLAALAVLRHPLHAWAVTLWLRARARDEAPGKASHGAGEGAAG